MILDAPPSSLDLAAFLLDMVDRLYDQGAQESLNTRCRIAGITVHESVYSPASNEAPAFYWMVSDDGHSLFVGGGTENYPQGQALVNGYTISSLGRLGSVNTYLVALANAITTAVGFRDFLISPTQVFAGHSLGGSLALALAAVCRLSSPAADHTCVTFGAPRSGGISWEERSHLTDVKRWMNDDDPVPLVPPTISQCPPLALVYGPAELRSFADQRHLSGGEELHPDGTTDAAVIPSRASISPTTDLASWLVSLVRTTASPHQTAEYRKRIGLIPRIPNLPGGHRSVVSPEEERPAARPVEIQREVTQVRQSVNVIGEAQGQGPVVIPAPQLFRAVKIGSVWYTVFGNKVISVGPRRRRAGLLAQAGNAFLRRLQRQAQVDPSSLGNAWEIYLALASDPTSGIRPTLRIGL